jgi:LacI family transcriptional regulator, galactose operon repressor
MKNTQVTIKDIAKIAGVSFSTVSRCLNNSDEASEKTKKKIQRIADDLGFEFNASARGLITSQVGTVAIVLPEQYTEVNVSVYHSMLMNSLRTSLEKADVDLIVTYEINHYNNQNNIIRLITRKKIDGLILLVENIDKKTLTFLKEQQIPFVFTHYPPARNISDQDIIFTDHYAGGKMAAEYLLKKGRKSFVIISEKDHLEFTLREQGFCETIAKAGYQVEKLYCKTTYDSAEKLVKEKTALFVHCDGLFTVNDLMAFGSIRALEKLGYDVPRDISVIGYDNNDFAMYFNPPLTTIHQPKEELAMISCERLFNQIDTKKNNGEIMKKRISIQPVLIERGSC